MKAMQPDQRLLQQSKQRMSNSEKPYSRQKAPQRKSRAKLPEGQTEGEGRGPESASKRVRDRMELGSRREALIRTMESVRSGGAGLIAAGVGLIVFGVGVVYAGIRRNQ